MSQSIMEDIPIFYLAVRRDTSSENYLGFTGRHCKPPVNSDVHRHRVYFTRELLDHIAWRQLGNLGGPLELRPPQEHEYDSRPGAYDRWFVRHRGGYVWRLHFDPATEGYVLGVWPD